MTTHMPDPERRIEQKGSWTSGPVRQAEMYAVSRQKAPREGADISVFVENASALSRDSGDTRKYLPILEEWRPISRRSSS